MNIRKKLVKILLTATLSLTLTLPTTVMAEAHSKLCKLIIPFYHDSLFVLTGIFSSSK